jgi:hypothetical protein
MSPSAPPAIAPALLNDFLDLEEVVEEVEKVGNNALDKNEDNDNDSLLLIIDPSQSRSLVQHFSI